MIQCHTLQLVFQRLVFLENCALAVLVFVVTLHRMWNDKMGLYVMVLSVLLPSLEVFLFSAYACFQVFPLTHLSDNNRTCCLCYQCLVWNCMFESRPNRKRIHNLNLVQSVEKIAIPTLMRYQKAIMLTKPWLVVLLK